MSFTFKQFSSFIDEATVEKTPEQLDEIFSKIFGKKADDKTLDPLLDRKKINLMKKRDALLKQKEHEEERRRVLRKVSDEQWARAKHSLEGNLEKIKAPTPKIGKKDDYPFHRIHTEAKSVKPAGFFVMSDATKIQRMDLDSAKQYLMDKIDRAEGARPANIAKARTMVNKATSVKKLMLDVSNFILAHETDSLKVIK